MPGQQCIHATAKRSSTWFPAPSSCFEHAWTVCRHRTHFSGNKGGFHKYHKRHVGTPKQNLPRQHACMLRLFIGLRASWNILKSLTNMLTVFLGSCASPELFQGLPPPFLSALFNALEPQDRQAFQAGHGFLRTDAYYHCLMPPFICLPGLYGFYLGSPCPFSLFMSCTPLDGVLKMHCPGCIYSLSLQGTTCWNTTCVYHAALQHSSCACNISMPPLLKTLPFFQKRLTPASAHAALSQRGANSFTLANLSFRHGSFVQVGVFFERRDETLQAGLGCSAPDGSQPRASL